MEVSDKKPVRNVSIDLLKIISMFMVVVLHATSYGIEEANIISFSEEYWIETVLHSFSIVAVNCFVLITGYFLCTAEFNYKKILNLWIQVEVYSIGIYLILCLVPVSGVDFSARILIEQVCSLLTNQYWFFTCYALLFFISPWLNRLINILEKSEYEKLLAGIFVVFSLIPTINIFGDSFGTQNGYSLLWFVVLYLIAGYIRKFPLSKKHFGIGYIILCIANLLLTVLGQGVSVTAFRALLNLLTTTYNSCLVLGASICLFLFAEQSTFEYGNFAKKIICRISGLSFGVYLLHENRFFRNSLWNGLVRLSEFTGNTGVFFLRFIGAVLLIFLAGIGVEWIRNSIINILYKRK